MYFQLEILQVSPLPRVIHYFGEVDNDDDGGKDSDDGVSGSRFKSP